MSFASEVVFSKVCSTYQILTLLKPTQEHLTVYPTTRLRKSMYFIDLAFSAVSENC